MSRFARLSIILSALAVASACTDRTPGPTGSVLPHHVTGSVLAGPRESGLAGVGGSKFHRPDASHGSLNPLQSAHAYALLGVAQYLAVREADAVAGSNGGVSSRPSEARWREHPRLC